MQIMKFSGVGDARDAMANPCRLTRCSAVLRCCRAAWLWFASDLDSGPSGYCPLDSGPPPRVQIRLGIIVATTDPSKCCSIVLRSECWATLSNAKVCNLRNPAKCYWGNAPGLKTAS